MDPQELRDATRAEHDATESLMPLMSTGLTREIYVQVLGALSPLVQGWESWVDGVASGDLRGMLERRRRSHLLRADLEAMGVHGAETKRASADWHAIVTGEAEPSSRDPGKDGFGASLLGAVYVVEGSTLGGRFLARHVEQVLGMAPGVGDSYFQGHGELTGEMWREVLEKVRAIPDQDAGLTIAAAKRTFGAFGEALRTG